jgi:type IV pilus assembly protein PilX
MAAIRGSGMQELMAGNMRDMQLRFQAAEAGGRVGETHVDWNLDFADLPIFNDGQAGFLSNRNRAGQTPVSTWGEDEWAAANALNAPAAVALDLPAQPRYVLEEVFVPAVLEASSTGSCIDIECQDGQEAARFYRISSYYTDAGTGAGVFVQTIYKN